MRTGLLVLGILLLVVGGVWMGQGANLIPGSFMTGQTFWLIVGAIVLRRRDHLVGGIGVPAFPVSRAAGKAEKSFIRHSTDIDDN